jgi:hypothetical protein
MVSQLQQEVCNYMHFFFFRSSFLYWFLLFYQATQCSRPESVFVPMPESAYILSNVPSVRVGPITTATKSGRVSKPTAKRKAT